MPWDKTAFAEGLRAMQTGMPKPAVADALVEPEFVEDMIRLGKAAVRRPGQDLPPNVEFEVIYRDGEPQLIRRRIS